MISRTRHETRFPAHDALSLYEQWWLPAMPPRAAVVVVHGLAEHSGRYAELAANLNAAGYAVYAYDQRGHGRSHGSRAYIGRFEHLTSDLDLFLTRVRDRIGDLPLFLLGHSVGGAVAAAYTIAYQPALAGVILSSPALKPGDDLSTVAIAMATLLGRILPGARLTALNADTVSRIPEEVAAYNRDPLIYRGRIPARTGAQLLSAFKFIQDEADAITVPTLLFHGTADQMVDPEGTKQLAAQLGSADSTLTLYEGAYHETLNDLDRDRVLSNLIGWLDARCP